MNKKKYTYLDWASAAPVSESLLQGFAKAMEIYANPSSPHALGAQAKKILDDSRKSIARITGVKTDGVIFTSGATEANALAIQGHVRALLADGRKIEELHLLYLPTSHSSVVEAMQHLKSGGAKTEALVLTGGAVDLEQLKKQLRLETVLVSMDLVCGETGTKFHTRDVHRVIATYMNSNPNTNKNSRASKILLHVDASQAAFTDSLECNHLGADLLTLDAQKVGGVRGIGALIRASTLTPLLPLVYGGGQEFGLRPGTENPALAATFAVALQKAQDQRGQFSIQASEARKELISTIISAIPDAVVNAGKESVSHILNISFPGRDTDYAVMLLSEAGFAVSTKSACETDAVGSRVVMELTGDEARALSTLRISWGPEIKPAARLRELQSFTQALIQTISFLDSNAV